MSRTLPPVEDTYNILSQRRETRSRRIVRSTLPLPLFFFLRNATLLSWLQFKIIFVRDTKWRRLPSRRVPKIIEKRKKKKWNYQSDQWSRVIDNKFEHTIIFSSWVTHDETCDIKYRDKMRIITGIKLGINERGGVPCNLPGIIARGRCVLSGSICRGITWWMVGLIGCQD